nr:zinc finger, CCHC-type [Tanacetum cinerariifolium]
MLKELKTLFAQQAEQELLQTVREFHAFKQEEGQSKKNKNKKPQLAARGNNKGKGKSKLAYAPKLKISLPPKKEDPVIITVIQAIGNGTGFRRSKKLKPGALSLYMGNGQRVAVEAIKSYDLCFPSGLVIVLHNCHYAPSKTKGVISVSRLYDDEMQSIKDNGVWDLVDLPPNGKTVGSKWFFKKKTDMDEAVYTYKALLVVKGFTQTSGIDYEETFSLVADIRVIRILIAIVVFYDYEIWKIDSTKPSIFATSSAEAEYIGSLDASKEAVWVRKFIVGLEVVPTVEEPIKMYCNNTGDITLANESGITKGARHYRAKVYYFCEVIEYGDVKLEKVHTDDNLADPFTKALAFPKHSDHTKNIGMLPASNLMKICVFH